MKKRGKERHCRCCGETLPVTRLRICEACQLAGHTIPPNAAGIDTKELESVALERQAFGMPPLEGFTLDEIAALAWTYRREGYGSYGKLRAYVRATGRMPERKKYAE